MTFPGRTQWDEIAVLVNENARRVNERVKGVLKNIIPRTNLYVSRTFEEARASAREIVRKRHTHVLSAGGDGSAAQLVNLLRDNVEEGNREIAALPDEVRERTPGYSFPVLGLLKLGTGNGWARTVRATAGVEKIKRLVERGRYHLTRFDLIESEDGRLFHFSGFGWDAAILNDYLAHKARLGTEAARRWLGGLAGYLWSLSTRTIPKQLARKEEPRVEIHCEGEVLEVGPDGSLAPARLDVDGRLYSGPANILGVGTIPYYGFALKAYPHARRIPGFMNLRIVTASVGELVNNCPEIWRGAYRSGGFKDYLARRVHVRFSTPQPFHQAGEAEGERSEITYQVSDHQVDVMDFHQAS